MNIRIRLIDGRAYQLDGVKAEKTTRQLNSENEFTEFNFDGAKTRIYKQHIVSVEWRGEKNERD